jgi:tetratricopeptide (TPR) repeat protein
VRGSLLASRGVVRWLLATLLLLCARPALASSSCDELVRSARLHEASGEPEAALRQYNDAVSLDATCAAAWLGLGSLRARMGDAAEAERVYDAALTHVPSLGEATLGRARTRWALGRRDEAESDMQRYVDLTAATDRASALRALEELAGWYRALARPPAELACWRRVVLLAPDVDTRLAAKARGMVGALEIAVAEADPVRHPPPQSGLLRRVVARLR